MTTISNEGDGDRYQGNEDGTVTLITPSGGEHTYDPADLVDEVFNDVYPLRPIDPDSIPF